MKHMGRPMPNAVLLGGFAAISGQLAFKSVEKAIKSKFSGKVGDGNIAAALATNFRFNCFFNRFESKLS
jgi:pyruvate ferredoxin oxidoreductase gamma subunit